ncbi:MAG: YHS domain-containing protein [Rhodospirillaceae bacterium]|nr:YHS domain-containing protein [Rhodospirillaceae bacterium]
MPRLIARLLARLFVAVAVLGVTASLAAAEKPPVFSSNGAAIRGYDPVAYFTQGKAVKGDPKFSAEYKGAVWHFASAAHRDAFKADPAKYAPQYGGYCAFGTAQGYAVPIDPEAWRIVGGKLYLNNSKAVQQRWNQNVPGYIDAADKNWPKVLKE